MSQASTSSPLVATDTQRRSVRRWSRIAAVSVLVILALGATRTVISRMANARTLESVSTQSGAQYVRVTKVRASGTGETISLPGTLQGFVQSPVSSRAGGYLRRWTKDIGSRVEKGELLAEVETPELDQQLGQAVAARNQMAAAVDIAKSTQDRWEALRQRDAVSQQELEERRSNFAQARANLAGADANVERLRQLQSFKRVVAPFAGVITRRNVDTGDLIDSNRPLFLLSQTDPLRVYVNVPQAYAQLVKPGQKAVVTQAEMRGRSFAGSVARTAGAIDTGSRTLQVEVALPNKDGALMPGAFVQVDLSTAASGTLTVPANALLFRGQGVLVARVDQAGKIHLQGVRLGRNFGDRVEVADGLSGNETLVLNPSDSLSEGDKVQVVADAQPAARDKAAP